MSQTVLMLFMLLGTQRSAADAEPNVLFQDSLKEKIADGWEWLRENPKTWRNTESGLEIRVEPGLAATVKNALLRNAPDRSQGQKPVFKLVHEFIDKKLHIIPGKKSAADRLVQLRLIVGKDNYVAQFRPDAKGEFQTAASGKLPPGSDEKISIQCYNGPPGAEHW